MTAAVIYALADCGCRGINRAQLPGAPVMIATPSSTTPVIDSAAFLAHWQGHRRLTRRVIAAFPDPDLFKVSIGGMRPFATMAMELIDIASAGVRGVATGDWRPLLSHNGEATPSTRAELL